MKKPNNKIFYRDLFARMDAQSLIITPTNRAATRLQREYAVFQLEQNTYSNGNILSMQNWLEKLWQQYQDNDFSAPRLLTAWQTQCLWRNVVKQIADDNILAMQEIATLAQEAWALLCAHNIPLHEIVTPFTEEVDFCKTSVQSFQAQCQREHVITREMLPLYLAEKLSTVALLPTKVFCVGFDYISPAIQALLTACAQHGTSVIDYEFPNQQTTLQTLPLADSQAEWLQAATWAKAIIADNPQAMIGIVIPQISEQWEQINTTFARVLSPETFWSPVNTPAYNISAGQNLTALPLIKAALQLLQLNSSEISMDELSNLLLSPFIHGAQQEYTARALLEAKLRKKQQYRWRWNKILARSENCKILHTLLSKHVQRTKARGQKTPLEWRDEMIELLSAWGWPGEVGLNTIEYQTVQHFLTVLNEFVLLTDTVIEISFDQALELLTKQAAQTIFQRETEQAQIHILGLLEASGLMFDALWITGVHEKNFPAQLKPHPLLPISLQLKYKMQEASFEICQQFYQKLLARLLQAAQQVSISYPQQENGIACEASPFIKDCLPTPVSQPASVLTLAKALQTSGALETWQDEQGPIVLPTEAIKGGTGILQAQAQCPFQAFVRYRLHAQALEKVAPGLSSLQRGQLVHDVLAKFWEDIKTQDALLDLSSMQLEQAIAKHIDVALNEYESDILPPLHLQAERKRLNQLITYWLTLETQRMPFAVVGMETAHKLTIGELPLDLRIDRIDTTEDGAIILDYKTGETEKLHWLDSRPDLAQLLVYALCVEDCTGIALGLVKGRQPRFSGLTEHHHSLPGVKAFEAQEEMPDWSSLKQYWRTILENLSTEFCAGDARVVPKADKTCTRCHYSGICRIQHLDLSEDA